jgi:hypothetical protein
MCGTAELTGKPGWLASDGGVGENFSVNLCEAIRLYNTHIGHAGMSYERDTHACPKAIGQTIT